PHPHLPPLATAAHLPSSFVVPCYSPRRSLLQNSASPATVAASPAMQLLLSPSAATLLTFDLPCSQPVLSNHSERPTLYSFSTVLLAVAAFLLLNHSCNHSRWPYLYCRCILFFPSSVVQQKQRTLCSFCRS
ncbi:hypothetical protein B296_00047821, partial [Ensete ventricosum]